MFKSTKTKIAALVTVGVVVLSGAAYTTSALAAGGSSAAPATVPTTAAATQTTADPQLRASVLDMLKDRMGLTGADAEKFADQMIARMQSANPNLDLKAMIDWCNRYIGEATTGSTYGGRGMMGSAANSGRGYCGGRGAAGQSGQPAGRSSGQSGNQPSGQPKGQPSGANYGPRGMMGGNGMMGGSGMMGSSGIR